MLEEQIGSLVTRSEFSKWNKVKHFYKYVKDCTVKIKRQKAGYKIDKIWYHGGRARDESKRALVRTKYIRDMQTGTPKYSPSRWTSRTSAGPGSECGFSWLATEMAGVASMEDQRTKMVTDTVKLKWLKNNAHLA